MENIEIRTAIKKARLFNWEVAEEMGISESYFCRKLRRELPEEERNKVLAAIDRLTKGEI